VSLCYTLLKCHVLFERHPTAKYLFKTSRQCLKGFANPSLPFLMELINRSPTIFILSSHLVEFILRLEIVLSKIQSKSWSTGGIFCCWWLLLLFLDLPESKMVILSANCEDKDYHLQQHFGKQQFLLLNSYLYFLPKHRKWVS
jgi:hypothetical protein